MSSGSSAVPLQAHRRSGNALVNNRPDDDRKPAGVDTSESSSDDDDFDDDFDDEMRVLMEGDDSDDGGHADDTESEAIIITSDGDKALMIQMSLVFLRSMTIWELTPRQRCRLCSAQSSQQLLCTLR